MITQITTHTADALARLPQQFQDKPKLAALISALVDPVQDLENAWWQLLVERAIGVAVGTQLDSIGVIVGQDRIGLSDDDYRRYLRARIAVNRSSGVDDDLIIVARLILFDPDCQIVLSRDGYTQATCNAAVRVTIKNMAITSELADILNTFLQETKLAGVRLQLDTNVSNTRRFQFDVTDTNSHAYLDLGISDVNLTGLVIEAIEGGAGGNNIIFQMAPDATPSPSVTEDDTSSPPDVYVTVSYTGGVTTIDELEALINTSTYVRVRDTLGGVTIISSDETFNNLADGGLSSHRMDFATMSDARD
jgi:hypothetical protein